MPLPSDSAASIAKRLDLPWVLIRKGKPPLRFATLDLAQRFYDSLRFNRRVDEDAAVFGPGNDAWYCKHWRAAQWTRGMRRPDPPDDAA